LKDLSVLDFIGEYYFAKTTKEKLLKEKDMTKNENSSM
jgi:hypothetical protein